MFITAIMSESSTNYVTTKINPVALRKANIVYNFGLSEYNRVKLYFFFRLRFIEDIYFFEVNTKYISSNVLKISVISRVRSTSEIADIFNTRDEIFLVFTEKKQIFFLFLSI